jgi:hypothetical protein
MEMLRVTAPLIHQLIEEKSVESHAQHLGKFALNILYCFLYAGQLHKDVDETWTISIQNDKKIHHPKEFSFFYAEYGLHLITNENSAW